MSSAEAPGALFPLSGGWLNIPRPVEVTFGAHFVKATRNAEICAELRSRRFLVAPANLSPVVAGRLRGAVDDAVEGALAMRGALPPSVQLEASLEETVQDQIFRAKALGATGLAIALPPLSSDVRTGVLHGEDADVVCTWLRAAREEHVVVVFDESDRDLRVMAPVPIGEIAGSRTQVEAHAQAIATPSLEGELADASACAEPKGAEAAGPSGMHAAAPTDGLRDERAAVRVANAAECRTHAVELDRARGPKPVAVVEKLFVTRYMPLVGAMLRGEVDLAVKSVADAWRSNFEHSYREGFSALRVTGKRPPMVFDAPEIAARIAKLNGARAMKLILVDAMRFDVGDRAEALMREKLAGHAMCVDRLLLWSALPTTTPTQLTLLARGVEGLRDGEPASDPEPEIARGRAISTLRRERLGTREVMKLDLVEARLRGTGPAFDDRLGGVAEEVATAVSRYVESLPARTLAFVFGDHGFRLSASPDGRSTGGATQGGTSPEEVLVPAYAWLVGGVH
jgi:hypothetical protein